MGKGGEDEISAWFGAVGEGGGSDEIHASHHEAARCDFFASSTYNVRLSLAVFLVSFGVIINNTSKAGEPKIATAMASLGFLFALWATVVFFRSNWPIQHRVSMLFFLILVILFLCVTVWLIVRIWIKF